MVKLLLVTDLPGVAQVAAHINLPILNCGHQVSLLPTMVLSHHTASKQAVVKQELGTIFYETLDNWSHNDFRFDAILLGYVASKNQLMAIHQFIKKQRALNKEIVVIIDPIMGDLGKRYSGFTDDFVQEMRDIIKEADLILPNLTELCLLTNLEYSDSIAYSEIVSMMNHLKLKSQAAIIVTGVESESDGHQIGFVYKAGDASIGEYYHHKYVNHYFGTGDLTTSLMSLFFLNGVSLQESIEKTSYYLQACLSSKENSNSVQLENGLSIQHLIAILSQEL